MVGGTVGQARAAAPSADDGRTGTSYGRHLMPPLPDARRAAVLILMYPTDAGWTIPLTLRPDTLPVHAGQVSLPGGRVHAGESAEQAACREFEEELGSPSRTFRPIGRLSPLFVYGSNFNVQPCVTVSLNRPNLKPNPGEVVRVLELPLCELLNRQRYGVHWIRRHSIRFRAPDLRWDGERIWGATRLILAELAAVLQERHP